MSTFANAAQHAKTALSQSDAAPMSFESKAAQKQALYALSEAAEAIKKAYQNDYLRIAKTATSEQHDVYYDFPDLHNWKEKHVALVNAAFPELAELASLMTALRERRDVIKAVPIVKPLSKKAAAKAREIVNADNITLMTRVLTPVLDDLEEAYVDAARSDISRIKLKLQQHDMIVEKAFKEAGNQRLAYKLTRPDLQGKVKFDDDGEKRYVESCRKLAKQEFDSFIHKMALKLGAPVIAEVSLYGSIWDNCHITFALVTGEKRSLITRVILNRSKLGRLFNQWPTRDTMHHLI